MKISIELPDKTKNKNLTYDPAILLMGIYLKKMKTLIQKDIHSPPCSLQHFFFFNNGQYMETACVHSWMNG